MTNNLSPKICSEEFPLYVNKCTLSSLDNSIISLKYLFFSSISSKPPSGSGGVSGLLLSVSIDWSYSKS